MKKLDNNTEFNNENMLSLEGVLNPSLSKSNKED